MEWFWNSIIPALLDGFSNTLGILLSIVFVEIAGFDIGRRRGIGIVEERLDTGEDGGDVVGRGPSVL